MLQSFMMYPKNPTISFQLFFIQPRLLGLHLPVQHYNSMGMFVNYFWKKSIYQSNYIYNRRCQKYPRRFVPILHWNGPTQTKTSFVSFVAQIKIEDHMFFIFWFGSSSLSYGPKRKGHISMKKRINRTLWVVI